MTELHKKQNDVMTNKTAQQWTAAEEWEDDK